MGSARIVQGEIPANEFALRETLSEIPEVRIEAERVVQSGEDAVMPLLWVRNVEPERFENAIEDDPSVREYSLLSEFEGTYLYQMEWISEVDLVLQMLASARATILEAYGHNGRWYLRILYPTQGSLTSTNEYVKEQELTFDVTSIREMKGEPIGRYGLTDPQFDALTTASNAGYYEIPREVDAQALADELGISHQALSERLRRATNRLIEDALMPGEENIFSKEK
jgi:predicted DNA binding protein